MRSRPWIFVLALAVTFLALIMYHGWSLFKANERIKDYLVDHMQSLLGEKSEIETLDMALGAVHLKGVHIVTNDNRYELLIQDLRIGYSLINLIKNGFKPQKSPQDVLFVQPEITIHYIEPTEDIVESVPEDSGRHTYLDHIPEFDFLKRITISRGSILYSDSTGAITKLVNDINGWISIQEQPATNVRLVGKLFDSDEFNTRLNGEIDLLRSRLNFVEVNISDFEFRERVPFFLPAYLDIHQGLVNGNFILTERQNRRNFDINGDISIHDGTVTLQDNRLSISDIDLDAEIKDWDFIIKRSQQNLNGSPVTVRGKIKNILNPEFQLVMESDSLDLQDLLRNMPGDNVSHIYGRSDISLTLTDSYQSPHIKGTFYSPRMKIDTIEFDKLDLNFVYQDSLLQVKQVTVDHNSFKLRGNASIDFTRPDSLVRLRVSGNGVLPAAYIPNQLASLANSSLTSELRLTGNTNAFSGLLNLTLMDFENQFGPFTFFNRLRYQNKRLTIRTNDADDQKILDGDLTFRKGTVDYKANLYDIHDIAYQIDELSGIRSVFDFDSSQFTLKKERNKLTLSGDYSWERAQNAQRFGNMQIDMTDNKNEKIIDLRTTASFGEQSYKGKGTLIKTDSLLTIKNLEIDQILNASGRIGLGDSPFLAARITFPNAELNHLYNLIMLDDETVTSGNMLGTIDITGSLNDPRVKGALSINNTFVNHRGVYDSYLEFDYRDQLFRVATFDFNKNGDLLFSLDGKYDNRSDNLDFRLISERIELDDVLPTVIGSDKLLRGNASIDLRLQGKRNKPVLIGNIAVSRGTLSLFHYDSLYVRFNGYEDSLSSSHFALNIAEAKMIRHNDFVIQANGLLPLHSDDETKISIRGTGNILSILPDITHFFHGTSSKSTWRIDLSGDPSAPTIDRGELHIEDGYLELGAVAPKIRSIRADVTIEPDGFVHVKDLSGMIRGRPFTFRNYRVEQVQSGVVLEPFTIPAIGLDLGVFSVETSSHGVPLNIPGLMASGENGYFEFVGRRPQERFYVAGPPQRPLVRGQINLRNVNMMYPFAESSTPDASSNPVVGVLKSIYWNVRAVPVKDIRYEKDFPSGVDKVYVNLSVDSDKDGLDFSGIINDETFRVEGKLESTEGIVDYLDFDFRIERVGVEFDKSTLIPIAYGQAKVAIADSLGVLNHIFLTLLLEDELSGHKQTRGRWGNINFQISTDNPNIGINDGEILATLGYSGDNIREKATDIIGISTDNLLFRPLFRPFERQLERTLKLDMVRLSSRFTRNLIEMNLWNKDYLIPNTNLYLLKSTRLMIGKYLIDDVFLSYTGQLESGMKYNIHGEELGLKHTLGLEYRINSNLLLELEYNYNSFLIEREDKRIFLRHSFPIQ